MSVRGVPLLDENYSIVEWIGVHTDVDDQKRAEEAMCRAKEAAESATRAKSEFLANMSHEIRTPMNGILGMTELALSTDLSTVQREYLGLVKSSADALLTVINDILDFSKIEAGKLDLEPVRFSPRDMVNDALRTLAIRAHEKGLELASRIAPGVPEAVLGDPGRLRQVLVNLVGNAIKFTERGEVIVNVGVGGPDDPPGELHFEVADTGIGIPADKRAAIFAPFEQADGSTTRRYGGTGLGLTISARLIALMGGRIWVEDNPGGGSRFRFNARLGPDPEAQLGPATASPILLDGLRVLVVDDNRTNRLILVEVLSQWGCQPVEAPGGPEAIEALGKAADRGEAFTLVLLDRMMPDMDGCELAGLIRGDARFGSPRMLMLTSAGPDDASQLRELGIDGWLAKPIRQSRLLNAMLDVLGSTDPNKAPILVEPVRLAPPIPRLGRSLRVLLAEDHPINQKVAARMLEDQGHKVTVVGDGRKAVEATAAQRFDVVLMDVQMPEMDGFEATAAIRAREALTGSARLPIIALTAHAMAGDRERCLRAGCDDYLSKPVDAASIARALARVVGETPSRTDPAPIDEPTDDRPAFDRDEALAYVCGDESLLAEILGLFLEDAPRLRAEIRAAIESRDAPTLARLAHTVVGVAGNFAAWRLVESARKLEAMGKTGELAGAGDVLGALEREFDRFRRAVEAARSDADADAATLPS
jgi:signal transduction histidine kinase/DNA-binding response OmpR family regulator